MEETDEFLFIFNLVVVCYAAVVRTLNVTLTNFEIKDSFKVINTSIKHPDE